MTVYPLKLSLLVFFLFFYQLSLSQDDAILWSEDLEIEWSDFKGKPQKRKNIAASISTGIKFSWSTEFVDGKQNFTYTLHAFMNPSESWVLPDKKLNSILEHERLHFDVTALVAFRFREALENYKPTKHIEKDLSKLYNEFFIMRNKIQSQYDFETNHSINVEKQKEWEMKIKRLLKPYLK